ncbi:MAG: hypothetical protein JSU72_12570 [Deltaproteobacteria bacterium]|nr:MAG: hypothetical protein JSU72_12570 [Deltaproteobacteria bacterium]
MEEQPFILGTNYWPQNTAMFMWRNFDRNSINEDMSVIADLGLSCVRIHLLWEDFQPEPRKVVIGMLDRLVEIFEMAGDRDLLVMPALFTGHVGGFNWLPSWMLLATTDESRYPVFSGNKVRLNKPKNPYTEPEIMEAQVFFLREVMSAVSGHTALLAWDLGNKPAVWTVPPVESAAELWLQTMSETLKERDDAVPITLSFQTGDLEKMQGFNPKMLGRYLDYLSVHVQPRTLSWADGPLDVTVLPFVGAIVEWLGEKPALIQEVGVPTIPTLPGSAGQISSFKKSSYLVDEQESAKFAERALLLLRRFNRIGAFWRSYGDYHPYIWDWPPLDKRVDERFYGILRHDGSPKPLAQAFRSEAAGRSEADVVTDWIDIGKEEFYQNSSEQLRRLYGRFRDYFSLLP